MTTPQTPLIEQRHAASFLISEANGHQSIDAALIAAGSGRLQPGTVLADEGATYTATAADGPSNAGNGSVTGAVAMAPALAGVYTITLSSDSAFTVTNPHGAPVRSMSGAVDYLDDGILVEPGQVGVPFHAGGIGFTVEAGSTPFRAGDCFTLTVAVSGTGWVPFTAAVASPRRFGLLYSKTDATHAPAPAAAVVRQAEVNTAELIWDASLAAADQQAALAALHAQGVIAR